MSVKYISKPMSEQERYQHAYLMLEHWIDALYHGNRVSEYFSNLGYKNIAIYGMGDLANRLLDDLEGSAIHVNYGIDRDAAGTVCRIENIYSLNDELPDADAVIVTPFYAFEAICSDLKGKVGCPVISIEEVIWSI